MIKQLIFFMLALTIIALPYTSSDACTRVVHTSKDGKYVVTGRSMDWFEDIHSNLWIFPRGIKRDGAAGKNSVQWVSKYGSVVTAGFDVGTTDGLNEAGLAANMLYLAEADYGQATGDRPGISWAAFNQYLLDNFATVAEVAEAFKNDPFRVVASALPGSSSKTPTLHWSVTDKNGDSAILEFLGGKLVIHHNSEYKVMTNSPVFSEQLALTTYWQGVGGDNLLPGTRRAADRFVRASFYQKTLPDPQSTRQAVANVMSVMRNVSVPFGETDPTKPNIAPTIWRTVSDSKNLVYYFESTLSASLVWVDLNKVDLKPGAPVKKINLVGNPDLGGDVQSKAENAKPFVFAGPES